MIAIEQRLAVLDLLALAGHLLDRDALEDWIECFAEEGIYTVLSRENTERGLPLPLMQCENKNMIRDRILSLRKANVTNPHYDRHVVGPPVLTSQADLIRAESSYALYQTTLEGVTRLFSVGAYTDLIRVEGGAARFVERTATIDLFSVPTMLSTPI